MTPRRREAGSAAPGRAAHRAADSGFTLVEMLVALALFALVAGAASLLTFTAARSQAASGARIAATESLFRLRQLVAADLGQAAARPTLSPEGALVPAFVATPQGLLFVRRGVSGLSPSIQKVAWGWDGRRLMRQSWPALDGAQPSPPVVLLDGVQGFAVRAFDGKRWSDRFQPERPHDLPRAVEIVITRAGAPPLALRFLVAG